MPSNLYVFFFPAEDGIRAATVTGVQTCALPISFGFDGVLAANEATRVAHDPGRQHVDGLLESLRSPPEHRRTLRSVRCRRQVTRTGTRSEERRVGKECRCGRERRHEMECEVRCE